MTGTNKEGVNSMSFKRILLTRVENGWTIEVNKYGKDGRDFVAIDDEALMHILRALLDE